MTDNNQDIRNNNQEEEDNTLLLRDRSISLQRQRSSQNTFKIQPKDFIIKNKKHLLEVYSFNNDNAIGEGGHASIFKLNELTEDGKPVPTNKCVKKFKKQNLFFKDSEIQSLKALDHPNIVKIYEYFEEKDAYYIVMEEVKGRDLFEEIHQRGKPFDEKATCEIIKQILLALVYTHSKGFCHRDIKLENIMVTHINSSSNSQRTNKSSQNLSQVKSQNSEGTSDHSEERSINLPISQTTSVSVDDKSIIAQQIVQSDAVTSQIKQEQEQMEWQVKLIDWSFGLDKNKKKSKYYNQMCGSLEYQAPEYFMKQYTEKIDIWALGVVMYTMLCNKYPFNSKTKAKSKDEIRLAIQKY